MEQLVAVRTSFRRLIVEQALALVKELEQTDDAPGGQVLDRREQVILGLGREFPRQARATRADMGPLAGLDRSGEGRDKIR